MTEWQTYAQDRWAGKRVLRLEDPGMLMTVLPLLDAGEPLDGDTVREAITGNLCRCTGYETIVDAVVQASLG